MTDLQKWKYECEIAKLKNELSEAKKNERAAQKGAKTNAEVSKIQADKIWGLMEENRRLREALEVIASWRSGVGGMWPMELASEALDFSRQISEETK